MLGHRALTVEDYMALLKKRGWMIALPAVLLTLIGWGISNFVPPQFISQSLVLIEQQSVPGNIVQSVVSEDLYTRLASMKEQILSRSRLEPIVTQYALYANKKMSMDDRIDQIRKDIDIKPIHSEIARTGGLPGFSITFKAGDPHTAQQVCGQITTLFVNENIRSRSEASQGTTDFLQSQLDDAKRNLDEQEKRQADFQRQYMGRLPEEEAPNMNMLSTLNTQLEAVTQQLTNLQNQRSYTETMLAAQQRESPSTPSGQTASAVSQEQQQQLQTLLNQEADLTTHYTDDYPDVVAVRRRIKELRAQMSKPQPAAPSTPAAETNKNEPMSVLQLRASLRTMDAMIAQKTREQADVQSQVRMYQERVASTPMVQEQYKEITRDYQTAQAFYDDLLKKMNASKMATDLEKRQQGEQFRVMDPPNVPEEAAYPKKIVFAGAGTMVGLMLGLLIVGWIEYRDTALRSERDIWAFTRLPTLATISLASDVAERPKRSWFGKPKQDIPLTSKPLAN